MRPCKLLLIVLSACAICGCSLIAEIETPQTQVTPFATEPKTATTDSPALVPSAMPEPLVSASINLYESLDLGATQTVEMIPNVPGGSNVIIEGPLAQRLAEALDGGVEFTGRARCLPTYTLVFHLTGGELVELGVVGCDVESPPFVRGEQALFDGQDAATSEAMGLKLAEIIGPMLPHPSPTDAPGQPDDQPVPAGVLGAFEQALALLREANLAQSPATGLQWTIEPNTPEGLLGATHYDATATDWGAQIIAPVVAPGYESYSIKLFHHPSAFEWAVRIVPEGYEIESVEQEAPDSVPVQEGEVSDTLYDALGVALVYLHAHYPEAAPEQGLQWTIEYATPEDLVGAGWFDIQAAGWEGQILAPVVAPQYQTYNVTVRKSGTDIHWVVVVDAQGNAQEMPSAAAGAVETVSHHCEGKSFVVMFRSDWALDDQAVFGGHEGIVTLARDGWLLGIQVATSQEDLPMVMGGAAGAWQAREPLLLGNDLLDKQVLVYEGKVKACKYYGESQGRIVYVHLLDQTRLPYDQVSLPVGLEHEVDQIVRSLSFK